MQKKKKLGLAFWIFVAMVAGILVGLCFLKNPGFTTSYIKPIGTIFINLLKFIVVPIVLLSLICGMISMKDIKKVGSIGWKTIVYYMVTTLIAIVIGLVVANIFKGAFPLLDTTGAEYTANSANFMDTIVNIFPSNFWAPLVNASMLQVIVIALLIGAGILLVGEKAEPAAKLFESLNAVFMKIMMLIIKCSPIGVFCLMVNVVAVNGPAIVGSLAIVLGVAYLGYIIHMAVVYSAAVASLGKKSPLSFFKNMIPAIIFAFTSTSSVATLPLTKECSDKMGANPEYSSFILPLGATINMDGTAIYMGVATIFIATCYGVTLTMGQLVSVVLTATLASIGTAGVSGAGMIMLAMVLESVGLPVEGIALIYGVDKIFDMGRTTLNIVGDASCAVVVSKIEERRAAKKAAKAAKK
ncbi:MAG: dicarboxylate/amino acid:cation symporter [Clostridia bacterium]|nr:dicarboxylate/amino acid:cation symporter [Clostridia bacterium]